jgi:hypothetical protein
VSNETLEYKNPSQPDATEGAQLRAAAGTVAQATSAGWGRALTRVLRQPAFLVVAGVLLVAAIGLNAAVNFMSLHFKKERVELAHELGTIPARIGTWVQVTPDQPLDSEMQEAVGTDKYIFREDVNEAVVGAGAVERFKDKDTEARRKLLREFRQKFPNGVVRLSVTYYTGMVDTVAHVPDRCVTADGYEPTSYDQPQWPLGRDLPAAMKHELGDQVQVRYINFENQTGASIDPCNIAYFFSVNGTFACDPLDVRGKLANLWETKAYYCKIETMTMMQDKDQAAGVQKEFLQAILPDVVRCMPDWEKAHGRPSKIEVAAK